MGKEMGGGAAAGTGEFGYLEQGQRLLDRLNKGEIRCDRTGVGTASLFSYHLSFDLREGFPLLTTKRVYWKGVAEELLWFLSGETSAKLLQEKGVHIWDGNGSRENLDNMGFRDYETGELGPIYGWQWRRFGAKYPEKNGGVDQMNDVLRQIRDDPFSRRIIVSGWNPVDLPKVALPCCHCFMQFYVDGDYLDIQVYQRSADWFLGVPFNIASYALLLTLAAHLTNKMPRHLHMIFGDTHLYSNHKEAMEKQLKRDPTAFPTLKIRARGQTQWEDFCFDDFELENYHPHPGIKADMAV